MILEYNGQTVDFFYKLFNETQFTKIGIWLSGGADSAFCLWWLAKIINDNELYEYSIVPVHGVDEARIGDSSLAAIAVTKFVKNYFPNVGIGDPYIFKYYKDPKSDDKGKFHTPILKKLVREENYVDVIVNSYTKNPPIEVMKENDFYKKRDRKRDYPVKEFQKWRPFEMVDKSFLAYFYKKYELNDLFKITVSCTGDIIDKKYPCEKCFWCREKYWAFGVYDGGSFL